VTQKSAVARGVRPNPIPLLNADRPGSKLSMVSLAPSYDEDQHQVYLDLVERALRHPQTRSIALTGSFGSGKSSVLSAIPRMYWGGPFPWLHKRVVVELSLSTLDPDSAPIANLANPAETEAGNRIQKELVKQLLYQLPPRKTPRSRFPRASRPAWSGAALAVASVIGLSGVAWVVTMLGGWQADLAQRLADAGWSVAWFWLAATAFLIPVALMLWRRVSGRYALQAGVKSGPLNLTLEPTASSYFDQYLDEIMYFFQVSKASVVLIEDVDRFDDAAVFDTLRALNTLVNSSGQIGRRVVFVYAIRDSVLGRVGTRNSTNKTVVQDDPAAGVDAVGLEMDRANRAKYFDVIIPLVPFVTADNARDLMMRVMAPRVHTAENKEGISPALIRLAARHVADMRTLWSIRNEFEVHLDRLITSANPAMPQISPDIVFALVLLRATSPEAYEAIRLNDSPLDQLHERWVALVEASLKAETNRLTELSAQLQNGKARSVTAERAGRHLDDLRGVFLDMRPGTSATSVQFEGPLSEGNLTDPTAWQQIAAGTSLTVGFLARGTRVDVAQVGAKVLGRLIGIPVDEAMWRESDLKSLKDEMRDTESEIAFLRHHTWAQLYGRPDLTVVPNQHEKTLLPERTKPPAEVSFADLVDMYAPTPLARELIANGYITRHFARYASAFYGEVVGLDAAEYISRAIDPGLPITEYALDDEAISEILREQLATGDDADLFDDPSVYNLDIVSYLIAHRAGAAQRVANNLATRWGELEVGFVERFFQREGDTAVRLAAMMAPTWAQAIHYTAVDAEVTRDQRIVLVNAVIGAIGAGEREDLDPDVGTYLSENYSSLTNLTHPADGTRAAIVMGAVKAANGAISDLSVLDPTARMAATQLDIYPISPINLAALGGSDKVTLDVLRESKATRPIYTHVVSNLADYLDALPKLTPPGTPIRDHAEFAVILNDMATLQEGLAARLVQAADPTCRVVDLADVESDWWPVLVTSRRTDLTFSNVKSYIDEYGLDDELGASLAAQRSISLVPVDTPPSELLSVASAILAARKTIPDLTTRVALAVELKPGTLPISEIAVDDANLIGPLLAVDLLADAPATFDPDRLVHWEDFEAAVAASTKFGDFFDTSIMPARFLAGTLQSRKIREEVKSALIAKLDLLTAAASSSEATGVAAALAARGDPLDRPRIESVRKAGASELSLVSLIVAQGNHLSIPDLRAILSNMPGDYARLSRGGRGTIRLSVHSDHRALLERLAGLTHTGATEVRTKMYGSNLEANLKQDSSVT